MLVLISVVMVAQCVILLALLLVGRKLQSQSREEQSNIGSLADEQWPLVGMIVPVGGNSPHMTSALTSLLTQDYPHYSPVFVTETGNEPAAQCIRNLQRDFPNLQHVVAGHSTGCGQKNHNTLQGITALQDSDVSIYVFCDSTHLAAPHFLRCLVAPLAQGQTDFSTGYHTVEHFDERFVTLAYCASVLLMRLMQGLSRFTQPWGGAMAIRRSAFERENIASLWQKTVVDDCSLAAMLLQKGLGMQLCASALLKTVARQHALSVWQAWMERQVLFLKFCIPFQWQLLGVLVVCMAVPPVFACIAFLGGLLGIGSGSAVAIGLCWLAVFWVELGYIRTLLDKACTPVRFFCAFLLASAMFARVYAGSIKAKSILWQGREYNVGEGGFLR